MNIQEIKDLMAQFDASSLREFSFKTNEGELAFSKNEQHFVQAVSSQEQGTPAPQVTNVESVISETPASTPPSESIVEETIPSEKL